MNFTNRKEQRLLFYLGLLQSLLDIMRGAKMH